VWPRRMFRKALVLLTVAGVLLTLVGFGKLRGATLDGSITATTVTSVDLTEVGALDWVYWDSDGMDGDAVGDTSTTNQKAGASLISTLSYSDPNDDSDLLQRNMGHGISYADGTSPVSDTIAGGEIGIDMSGTLAGIDDDSFSFTVSAGTTDLVTLMIYGRHRRTGTTITASIAGASDDVDTLNPPDTANQDWVYALDYQADNASDVLTITIESSGSSQAATSVNNSLRLGAAALVPEPGTALLVALSFGGWLTRRRR